MGYLWIISDNLSSLEANQLCLPFPREYCNSITPWETCWAQSGFVFLLQLQPHYIWHLVGGMKTW